MANGNRFSIVSGRRGVVSLVGAGPGDPGLLTLRAVERLREADVVFHDALVSPAVLAMCGSGARRVSVGKRRGKVTLPQEQIVDELVREARRGMAVVRLKGGDPFVFGRGGEEALALAERGVRFEIVPGISSGIGAPALAGIPLTHRGISGSIAFVTAHDLTERKGDTPRRGNGDRGTVPVSLAGKGTVPSVSISPSWSVHRLAHLARGADTLVIFMAGACLGPLRRVLLRAGLASDTPVAVIESGSLPDERIAYGPLARLSHLLPRRAGGPVLVVVGSTVAVGVRLRAAAAALEVPRGREARAHARA